MKKMFEFKMLTPRETHIYFEAFSTYMNWHVEVIRFECISHLPKCTQGIVSVCLFKAECLMRLVAFLRVGYKINK